MSDRKLLLFGSFTEDETRLFQKQYAERNVHATGNTGLQFGFVNFGSLNSSKGCDAEKTPKSEDTQSSKLAVKERLSNNGKAIVSDGLRRVSQSQLNGSVNGCLPNDSKVIENPKNTVDLSSLRIAEDRNHNVNSLPNKHMHDWDGRSVSSNISLDSSECASSVEDVPKILNKHEQGLKILIPRGLINSGNLCFLNATLQALLSCPSFVRLLQDLRNRNIPQAGYPTLHAFADFISNFDLPNDLSSKSNRTTDLQCGMPFNPNMFEHVLKKFTPDVPTSLSGRPRQEDAQEFLSFVMDQMHDELLKLKGPLSSQNGFNSLVSSFEDDGWETVGPKNKSAVTRTQKFMPSELSAIFGGQLRSVVKAKGNRASATVQPFLLLHLDIHPEAVHTIEDALHLFSVPEALEGYKTSAGKAGEITASKSVKIQELSKILILHLMRFSYESRGAAKLHKPVGFPLELVISRELLVSSSSEGRRYELVATITHHGREPTRGHYTADTKSFDGRWLRCDDGSVMVVSTNKVLHDQAYLLFYRQV